EHYRTPFEPLLPSVKFIRTNDVASLKAAVSSKTAAIIAEPVLGEGGIRPLTPAFAAAITEICSKTGALLIADEVQSGVGRTGYPFYFKALGLHPQLVAVGKALGSGVPIGAALVSQDVADTIGRLLPPLVITESEVDEALDRLDAALGAVGAVE